MPIQTFDQVLSNARQLTPHEQNRLIALLAEALAPPNLPAGSADEPADLDQRNTEGNDSAEQAQRQTQLAGFARLLAVAAEIHAHYPTANVGERLEADRRERDQALRGGR